MKNYLLLLMISAWGLMVPLTHAQDANMPIGWATVGTGVTGGGSATAKVVSNYADFKAALLSSSVPVVHISGTITIPAAGRIDIKDLSNKTIFGLPGSKIVSTDMTKTGSGIFYMTRCVNFIMRNVVFEGPGAYDTDGYDNLCIDNCQRIWVDHCEFHDGMDGNFDIKNMSDYVSVTWCTFSYEKPPKSGGPGGAADHRYTNLIGSSDGATGDKDKLRVTFQYCWWGEGCRERMPRIRYGKIHLANNLFSSSVSNHCIRAGYMADIVAEGNYFDDQNKPIDEFENNYTAIKGVNNYGAADIIKKTAFIPPYTLAVAKAADIVAPIKSCAGATLPSPTGYSACHLDNGNKLPAVSLTAPAGGTDFNLGTAIELAASATDADGAIAEVRFYQGAVLLHTDNTQAYSYSWTPAAAGTYTITAVAKDNAGATATSAAVTITVTDRTKPQLTASSNTAQVVKPSAAIEPMVFTWGSAATGVSYTTLPAGLSATKDNAAKTLTVSGTPTASGEFTVSTEGGTGTVSLIGSVQINTNADAVLADWYPFQEAAVSLGFVTYTDASVLPTFIDVTKPANGVAYTVGALRLAKGVGKMTLSLNSLTSLKLRMYATGTRTMAVMYGPTGTEYTWNSPSYASGASELDLTAIIPSLVSASPIIVTIINSRTDGGSYYVHDLYVEGSAGTAAPTPQTQTIALQSGWNLFSFYTQPDDASVIALFNGIDVKEIKDQKAFWNADNAVFLNSLQTLQPGKGYLVYLNTAAEMSITGLPIPEGLATLLPGWNLIASPTQQLTPIGDFINAGNCAAAKNFDSYWLPDGSGDLESFSPGKAYYILGQ